MKRVKRTFKQVGKVVVVKNTFPDTSLSPKEVLISIESLEGNIKAIMDDNGKHQQNIVGAQEQIKMNDEKVKQVEQDLKDIQKFEEWAMNYQERTLKYLIAEVKDECFNKVTVEYTFDKGLDDHGNNMQKYRQYQHKITTHPKIAEAVAQSMINDMVIINSVVDNPFI